MKITHTQFITSCKNLKKTILLHLFVCVASLNLFATNYTLDLPPVDTCESCAIPGITPETYVTGTHAVIYAGRTYNADECKTYFFYCIVNDGGTSGSDISNTHFGDLDCANTCLETNALTTLGEWSVDNNNNIVLNDACGIVEYGTDPTTGICGVKHDEESEGACYEIENCGGDTYSVSHLYIAVEGNVPEATVTVGIKFGNESETLEIPGPGACEDQGCDDDAPIAVDDVDSTYLDTPVTGMSQTNDTPSDDGGNIWNLVGTNGGAANGTVTMTPEGTYTYTPNPGFFGIDVFVYKICDIDGDCDQATVTIYIDPSTPPLLNVALINFSVVKNGDASLLKWRTASEVNNDYFEIQRSIDNKNFVIVGKIQGAGNSNAIKAYEFIDRTPHVGVNFYRMRQVDFDGRSTITPVRMVNFNTSHAVSIFPNPTTTELSIHLTDWDSELTTTFKVIDFNGAEVLAREVTSETTRLNVAHLPAGTYFMQITNNITTQTYRFIKS